MGSDRADDPRRIAPGGRPRKADKREIVEAILYVLQAGCSWRLLPHDFPPWQRVYYYLRCWQRDGVWARVHPTLVMADRERDGRDASPSAAIIDSQTVRTADQKGDSYHRSLIRTRAPNREGRWR
ncbi:transposase [Limibaculum sp. FT325]|uniref:transposase n=1 Tax=Thermohalobaculum sediminis TaxID=2939436 RepID=UPI0020BF4B36|nr:transposase [Limibaculum sediminis]MCL5779288.1 transposase [Limibaculum sediminis]